MKKNDDRNKQAYLMLIGVAFMLPLVAIPWIAYLDASSIWLDIFSFISSLTVPFGVLTFYIASDAIYYKIDEDRKNITEFKKMKPIDLFYRYIPAEAVKFALLFIYLGIAMTVILNTKETDMIAQLFGGETIAEICILSPLAMVFYTIWALYCNEFSTNKGKIKYVLTIIAILIASIFMSYNI